MAPQNTASAPHGNNNHTQAHDTPAADQRGTGDLLTPVDDLRPGADIQQVTTKLALYSPQGTKSRDNFPLPRELRDQIYSYLLDGKHNQIKRAGSHRIYYKFHTSIIAVNRRIQKEAEDYLYKHNEFIIVSHDATKISDDFMPPWIPLVAVLGTKPMRYHSAEITFLLHHGVTHSKATVGAWLLLAQDLEKYCLAINLYLSHNMYRLDMRTPMLVLGQNSLFLDSYSDEDGRPLHPHYLRLDFGNNGFRTATAGSQYAILSRFRSMYSSSLHVETCGHVIQSAELREFRMAARPGLMCTSSLEWRAFWDLDSLKEQADSLTHDNELELADLILDQLWRRIGNVFPLQPPYDIRRPIQQLLLDTILTVAYLHLKTNDIPPFASALLDRAYAKGSAVRTLFPGLAVSSMFHVILLSAVVSGLPSVHLLDVIIAECIAGLKLPGSDSHQLHDAAILQQCPDHNKLFECEDLPLESCSVYALPPKCVNLRKAGEGIRTRDSIDGWLDKEMLRATSNETREEINRRGFERGWQVTPFEDGD